MWSASSSTRTSTLPNWTAPSCMWSSRRPGVATSTSTPPAIALASRAFGTPPKISAVRTPVFRPYTRKLSTIWLASSRVGLSTRTRQDRGRFGFLSVISRCRIGSAKAAVLPVPVWAMP